MNPVIIRNLKIGEGIPKICVPIVGKTKDEVIQEVKNIKALPADLVEWRADWFEHVQDFAEVEKVLCETDKENADFYTANYEKFCTQIDNAKNSAVKKLNHWQGRTFITYHAAFGYYADEFKLKQLAFEFNGREITPGNLTYLSRYAKQHKIKSIFIQSTTPPNARRAIQNAVKAKLVTIDPSDYNILKNLNRLSAELEAAFE